RLTLGSYLLFKPLSHRVPEIVIDRGPHRGAEQHAYLRYHVGRNLGSRTPVGYRVLVNAQRIGDVFVCQVVRQHEGVEGRAGSPVEVVGREGTQSFVCGGRGHCRSSHALLRAWNDDNQMRRTIIGSGRRQPARSPYLIATKPGGPWRNIDRAD